MKFVLLWLLLLTLTACQSTHVHVATQGYNNQQTQALMQKIAAQGFEVSRADIRIPIEFENTVLSVSPGFAQPEDVDALIALLNGLDKGPVQILNVGQGQHYYHGNQVGLYLRHPDVDKHVNMPAYLRTQYCKQADATIQFMQDGKYLLEYETRQTGYDNILSQQGEWQFDGQTLTLFVPGEQRREFKLSREMRETQYGPRPAQIFSPQQKDNALAALNCDFIIITIE